MLMPFLYFKPPIEGLPLPTNLLTSVIKFKILIGFPLPKFIIWPLVFFIDKLLKIASTTSSI